MTRSPAARNGRRAGRAGPRTAYRSIKRTVFSRTRLGYERLKEFFLLPSCYRQVRAAGDCPKTGPELARDLLILFFSYKTVPNFYAGCRLWEVDRRDWGSYYGSNYLPLQQSRLRRAFQPLEYRVLFNDKYVCVLLCLAHGFNVPRTYGVLDPDRDFRRQLEDWLDGPGARLIIKPLGGGSGRGILLAERDAAGASVRQGQGRVPLDLFVLREKAIVQEVVIQHPALAAFSTASVNTVRVVTLLTPAEEAVIVRAGLRMGVGAAFVDNWSAGGVAAGIDPASGRLNAHAFDKMGRRYAAHPTSGKTFEGFRMPAWDRIVDTAVRIQSAFPTYRLLGLDLALDADGEPVVIEINHGPDFTGLEQAGGPLLKNEAVLRAFGDYGLLVNRHQKRLYADLLRSRTRISEVDPHAA